MGSSEGEVICRITDIGVYVSLLEYNGIQGFIPASELSRRRIRSIPKLVQVGKIEPSVVTRVDEEKGGKVMERVLFR